MFTHIDDENNPTMVDVTGKNISKRVAKAVAIVCLPDKIAQLMSEGEIVSKKGPVLATARIAGTMAVKKTSELIPFCHAIPIESIHFEIELKEHRLEIICCVKTIYRTGVEMEALLGVQIAALTVYDMCKALSHEIVIEECKLLHKSGGKNDYDA